MKSPGRIDEIARLLAEHDDADAAIAGMSEAEIAAAFTAQTRRYSDPTRRAVAEFVAPVDHEWQHDTYDLFKEAVASVLVGDDWKDASDIPGSVGMLFAGMSEAVHILTGEDAVAAELRQVVVAEMIRMDTEGFPPEPEDFPFPEPAPAARDT